MSTASTQQPVRCWGPVPAHCRCCGTYAMMPVQRSPTKRKQCPWLVHCPLCARWGPGYPLIDPRPYPRHLHSAPPGALEPR